MRTIHRIRSHRTLAIFAIIGLSIMLLCVGCAGSGYKRSVPAKAFPSGNVLEIDVGAELNPGLYLSFGANQFSSELPLSELVQKLRCDNATFQDVSAIPCNAVTVGSQTWDDLPQAISAFYEATGYFDTELQDSILTVRAKASAPDVPSLSLRFTRVEEQTYLTLLPLS